MTQLYVGNLSAEGDEKAIRLLFGKFGPVREVLMKSGYAFVEFESPLSAEEAMRELNGSDILGHPMIVEPSHQQRLSSRRKIQQGKVEVTEIPHHFTIQNVEAYMSQIGQVMKMEIEDTEFGMKKIIVTYETQEQAQRAATILGGEGNDQIPRVMYIDMGLGMRSSVSSRKSSPGIPAPPNKSNNDFPLRILVPSDMVGAIIGKDGATIRMITQITKARVDVHRRETMGTNEKDPMCTYKPDFTAITTIGPPECCTEACYQIMKIMQNELLMTNGMMESGKFHEPLPVVPLKILAHNELVGRVIGKGGGTLKRIMAESGTKITISKLKDLTAFNMERTITILGTIDNCKKAESLISAKLRASYESDMAQFIPISEPSGFGSALSPSPTNVPTSSSQGTVGSDFRIPHAGAQSLPATPSTTNVRTFTDYSGEHTRLTTLHGSTGALEVNNLGGFKLGPTSLANGGTSSKFANALESSINGIVRTTTTSVATSNGIGSMNDFGSSMNGHIRSNVGTNHLGLGQSLISKNAPVLSGVSGNGLGNGLGNGVVGTNVMQFSSNDGINDVDDMSDVFHGLTFKEPSIGAAPGYGRSRLRRSSAPVGNGGEQGTFGGPISTGYGLWGNGGGNELPGVSEVVPTSRNSPSPQFNTGSGSFSAGIGPNPAFNTAWVNGHSNGTNFPPNSTNFPGNSTHGTQSIWSGLGGSGSNSIGGSNGGSNPNGSQAIVGNASSRPNSQTSSYSNSDSSLSGISPIYSPTTSNGFGGFSTSENVPTSLGLLTTTPLGIGLGGEDRESRSPFRASVPTPLTTVAETMTTNGDRVEEDDFYPPSMVNDLLGENQPPMIPPISVGFQW